MKYYDGLLGTGGGATLPLLGTGGGPEGAGGPITGEGFLGRGGGASAGQSICG